MTRSAMLLFLCALSSVGAAGAQENGYENLKVLPADISRSELGDIMLDNLRGLGLRRLAGEGCLYCHVGDLEKPRSEWDYASDAKPMKQKARVMMAMVAEINREHLTGLATRLDSSFAVTCTTCHAGRTDPRPLPVVLWAAYEEEGIERTTTLYRELREDYFGGDAYDFRPHVVRDLATRMADQGSIDDAITLAALNADANPESVAAAQGWIALQLERTMDREGVEAALAQLSKMQPTLEAEVLTPDLLDSLAWRLIRTEREAQGHALIEANYEKYPGEYRAVESLAFILSGSDREAEALRLLESWIEANPAHDRARRLLVNMRSQADG